jgi:cytochrome c oxidase subunit IV
MSQQEPAAHAAHEEIHLPGPSWWPLTLAIGIALILTGLVVNLVMLVLGALIGIASLALWIRDARREYRALHD